MLMTRHPLLLIDDDPILGSILRANFDPEQFDLHLAETGQDGLDQARKLKPELAILDIGLPDINGMDVLEKLRASHPRLPVVMLTGSTEVKNVVHAMQLGAFDYLTKPVDNELLLRVVQHALESRKLLAEVRELHERRGPVSLMATQMGSSARVVELARQVSQVAESDFTVMVLGETGTGKELVAQAIHRQSSRRDRPLIALDCGAIPETLMESELFGHEKGAFTGADRKVAGQIQLAEGGTLFLDEASNLSPALQVKLLRVMESREVTPVGGGRARPIDVRFIVVANTDLASLVRKGEFREDLYFRLAQYTITLPPLRERPDDIPYLARRFLVEAALDLRKPVTDLTPEALSVLHQYRWPGNVRELRNVMRLAVLQCAGLIVDAATIPPLLNVTATTAATPLPLAPPPGASLKEVADAASQAAERQAICTALRDSGGNKSAASRQLKTDYKTLRLKMHRYGIKVRDFETD